MIITENIVNAAWKRLTLPFPSGQLIGSLFCPPHEAHGHWAGFKATVHESPKNPQLGSGLGRALSFTLSVIMSRRSITHFPCCLAKASFMQDIRAFTTDDGDVVLRMHVIVLFFETAFQTVSTGLISQGFISRGPNFFSRVAPTRTKSGVVSSGGAGQFASSLKFGRKSQEPRCKSVTSNLGESVFWPGRKNRSHQFSDFQLRRRWMAAGYRGYLPYLHLNAKAPISGPS